MTNNLEAGIARQAWKKENDIKKENKKTKMIKIVHVEKVNLETKQDVGKL